MYVRCKKCCLINPLCPTRKVQQEENLNKFYLSPFLQSIKNCNGIQKWNSGGNSLYTVYDSGITNTIIPEYLTLKRSGHEFLREYSSHKVLHILEARSYKSTQATFAGNRDKKCYTWRKMDLNIKHR